jgi:predicted DCC family thiol-disulfide oxidoreductase YuxK
MRRPAVLYDQDCGLCRWSADLLRAWDRRHRLGFAPLQSREADAWLGGMSSQMRYASWHLVEPDGRVWSAGAAIGPVLRRLPAGPTLATLVGLFPDVTDRLYRLAARHRARLGAIVGRRDCAVDTADHPASVDQAGTSDTRSR